MESKKTILVIEDEPHIALGLKDALEFEGFLVFVAENGKAGKELAQREHPDAILLDLMLPDMNGYDVCRDVRARDHFVPIIMLTAKSQEADKIRGLEAGADDYVTKPFSVGELVARIRAIFRRARRPSEAPTFKLGEATINIGAHTLTRDGKRPETAFVLRSRAPSSSPRTLGTTREPRRDPRQDLGPRSKPVEPHHRQLRREAPEETRETPGETRAHSHGVRVRLQARGLTLGLRTWLFATAMLFEII